MSHELELKLELSEETVTQFLNLDWFHSHPACERRSDKVLENIYFDTPELLLLNARTALRIRKSGNEYLQTLKTKGTSVGGLHQRGEWEHKIGECSSSDLSSSPSLQPDLFPQDVWPCDLDVNRLVPVFETNFTRSVWMWTSSKGSRIEVVLDRGKVVSNGQTTPLTEIELELLDGSPDCVFDLAEALSKSIPLLVSDVTKAQRGFELYHPGVWQVKLLQLTEKSNGSEKLEWVIQQLMFSSTQPVSDQLPKVLEGLVNAGVLKEMDVNPWLLFGDVSTLNPLLKGQWLLRLARYAWLHAQ
ncbi:inorganic triphosphatase [Litoribrevibacter euphylliae]|uniref:Inorganic triphosphatase n=1 Tax=Litoribrevibacter euphylliae TaxID=1834034 RepID=A0ABV7HHT7_9GAMM